MTSAVLDSPPDEEFERVQVLPLLIRNLSTREAALRASICLGNQSNETLAKEFGLSEKAVSSERIKCRADGLIIRELWQPPHAAD
ncbi:MAG: hypothetical protein K2V38_17685 [Gemmataceae bacterium]|nr:hypothetical protein [Gemmataceae bacterium]